MNWLANKRDTVFLGQACKVSGHAISSTLVEVPEEKRIELPVFEETQMGLSLGLALQGFVPVTIYPRIDFLLSAINQMVNKTINEFDLPDILINNAGINVFGEPLSMPDSEWKRAFSVDLDGVWFGCKAVLPHMLKKNKGSIVNVASVHGIQIIPNCFPYPVAKHGVIGLTKALAVDYASKGIKINSISPGYIDTPIVERFFKTKPDPDAARKEAENHQPIKRMGTTDEIANTIMFMSSDECNYMIGANIVVDGGITLRMHENDDTGAG